jgi:hypothetical protein
MAQIDAAAGTSGHRVRYKNTFLELDMPKTDLRRFETCPGRVAGSSKLTEKSTSKSEAVGARTAWADMDSDDEPAPKRNSWADMESDDEPLEQLPRTKTPPEPEAERSPRSREADAPVEDEWSTVQRKGSKQKSKKETTDPREAALLRSMAPRKPVEEPAAPTDEWGTVRRKGKKPGNEEPPPVAQAYPTREKPAVIQPRKEQQTQPRVQGAEASRARAPDRKRPEQRVEVGMEESPSFPVVKRLIGPSGANLKRIREACPSAVVSLRGKGCPGSGTERDQNAPLHFVITAPPEEMDKAVRMVEALVSDVRAQRNRLGQKRP